MLSVLLILDVPRQPRQPVSHIPTLEVIAPLNNAPPEKMKEAVRSRVLPSALPAAAEKKREAPAVPKRQYDFYELVPEMDVVVPDEEDPGHSLLLQKSIKETPAGSAATVPAGIWYLQAGSFQERARADELKVKLTGLGFKCEIQKTHIDDVEVFYYVRVGPFANPEVLDQSRQKLDELGVETQTVTERK